MSELMRDWQNFYMLMGGAAATLTGLMFVAVSIGSHLVNDESMESIRTYVNPTLFHFVAVVMLCGIMLVPGLTAVSFGFFIGLVAIIGLWHVLTTLGRMRQHAGKNSGDIGADTHSLWHGYMPLGSYVLALIVAGGLNFTTLTVLLYLLPIATAILLICAIRNTWLLVLWIASQH